MCCAQVEHRFVSYMTESTEAGYLSHCRYMCMQACVVCRVCTYVLTARRTSFGGLYSYGLYSCGLYSCGLYSCGLYSYGYSEANFFRRLAESFPEVLDLLLSTDPRKCVIVLSVCLFT